MRQRPGPRDTNSFIRITQLPTPKSPLTSHPMSFLLSYVTHVWLLGTCLVSTVFPIPRTYQGFNKTLLSKWIAMGTIFTGWILKMGRESVCVCGASIRLHDRKETRKSVKMLPRRPRPSTRSFPSAGALVPVTLDSMPNTHLPFFGFPSYFSLPGAPSFPSPLEKPISIFQSELPPSPCSFP